MIRLVRQQIVQDSLIANILLKGGKRVWKQLQNLHHLLQGRTKVEILSLHVKGTGPG